MSCFTWINDLWKHFFCGSSMQVNTNETSISVLPNDIMTDILCRLPPKSVLKCRQVRRQWLHLSSTPYFAENYLTSVTPILLGQERSVYKDWNDEGDVMFLLEGFEKYPKVTKVRLKGFEMMYHERLQLYASCNGFLLFGLKSTDMYVIYNPLTSETFHFFEKSRRICGFFFHHLERDYKLLLYSLDGYSLKCHYYICSLSTTHKKELRGPPYIPLRYYSLYEVGVVICGALFWIVRCFNKSGISHECSKSIMMFDMMTETFHVMPHPGSNCTHVVYRWIDQMHEHMKLLEVNNNLTSVNLCEKTIEVWVLEDIANWMWVKRHVVDIGCRFEDFAIYNGHPVVAIERGNLLLNWPGKGFFYCKLCSGSFRKMKRGSITAAKRCEFYFTRFTCSFVSNVFSDSLKSSRYIL